MLISKYTNCLEMLLNKSRTQYHKELRTYGGGKADRETQYVKGKLNVGADNLASGLQGFLKHKSLVSKNENTGASTIIKRVQKIDKRWFFIKYILLLLFFIAYGSILISLRETDSLQKSIKVQHQPPPSAETIQNPKPSNSSSKYEEKLVKSYRNKEVEQQGLIQDGHINSMKDKIQTQQKILSQQQYSQSISDEALQITPSPPSVERQLLAIDQQQQQQQSVKYQLYKSASNFPIAISRTEQSIVRDIISTYQDNYKKITRAEEQLSSINAQAINSVKRQIKLKQKIKNNQKTYGNFEDIIQQTSGKGQTMLFNLELFPFLRSWATTPRPTTKFQRLASMFKGILVSETYLWDDLYEMLDRGGYWQSRGELLTVATYSKVIDDQFGSLQIFTPTIIRLWFPYDIPLNQIITLTGIRMRYDLHSKVETRWISQYLGELRVNPTSQERNRRQPIQRVFYCEQQGCNYLYSLVQLKSNNNVRLHFVQIDSIFSVGR